MPLLLEMKMSWVKIPSCMEISSVNNGLPVFSKVICFWLSRLICTWILHSRWKKSFRKGYFQLYTRRKSAALGIHFKLFFFWESLFKELNSGSDMMSYLNMNYPVTPATFCRHLFWFRYSLWIPSCHVVVSFSCELSNITLFTCHPCTPPRILLMTSTMPLPHYLRSCSVWWTN